MTGFGGSLRRGLDAAFMAAVMAVSIGLPAVAASLPYTDPDAKGFVAFCDKNRHPVSSGSLYDQPFVWTAVSSTPAPKGYQDGKAILVAFQPREGVPPGQWSGRQLTASSTFTNPAHPMSQATYADDPLLFFTQAFPPKWEGLVQLRMYFSASESAVFRAPYPATTIRVTGDRWSVVSGGTVACNVGTATSIASKTLPKSALASPAPLTVAGSTAQPTSGSRVQSVAKRGSIGGLSGADAVRVGLIAVALIGGIAGGFRFWRRRRSTVNT
jgi:hypothetical protein